MTEALNFFLDDEHVLKVTENPDEGIDYIFMLERLEWEIIENEWHRRPEEWKSGITYLLGFCSLDSNKDMLFLAITDKSENIYEEGLLSLYHSITEETEMLPNRLSLKEKNIVFNQLNKTSKKFRAFPEYKELVKLMTE